MNTQEDSTSETTERAIRPAGSSIATHDRFWGRGDSLDILADRARKGIHTLLVGPRRMAKTSLLKEIQRCYKDEFIVLFLDMEKRDRCRVSARCGAL